jgi:hypothetical protein
MGGNLPFIRPGLNGEVVPTREVAPAAPPHSITMSAWTRKVAGKAKSAARAVRKGAINSEPVLPR